MKIRSSYYLLILGFCLLAVGCSREDSFVPTPKNRETTFAFNLHFPDEKVVDIRRSAPIEEQMIQNLYVLVFDQQGAFLSRTEAIRQGSPGSYSIRLTPTAGSESQLPPDKRKRIIHFIANHDWSGFSDAEALGKHENELVPVLSTGGGTIAYWQRIELADGISRSTFPATIELIRNVARINVRDLSLYDDEYPYLADTEFAISNYTNRGTVSPFSTSTLLFTEHATVEAPDGALQVIAETDFKQASGKVFTGEPFYCYERKNSTSRQPLYIIVRGRYATDPVGVMSYYKIDIVQNDEVLWDIVRNHHYEITINRVTGPGYGSLEQAMNSPASNNLLYSIVLQDYKSISDGVAVLNVGTTIKTLVEADKTFRIDFSYFPDGVTEDNTNVTVELEQSSVASEKVLASMGFVKTAGGAYIEGRTISSIPPYNINSARIIVTAVRDGIILRRVIQLRLQAPFGLGNFSVSPNPVPATVGSPVTVTFTIPNSLREQQYPFPVYITTNYLTPNLEGDKDNKLTLDYQIPGRFRYTYIVDHPGVHTVNFKTSSKGFSEILTVESELFQTATVVLTGS